MAFERRSSIKLAIHIISSQVCYFFIAQIYILLAGVDVSYDPSNYHCAMMIPFHTIFHGKGYYLKISISQRNKRQIIQGYRGRGSSNDPWPAPMIEHPKWIAFTKLPSSSYLFISKERREYVSCVQILLSHLWEKNESISSPWAMG